MNKWNSSQVRPIQESPPHGNIGRHLNIDRGNPSNSIQPIRSRSMPGGLQFHKPFVMMNDLVVAQEDRRVAQQSRKRLGADFCTDHPSAEG